MCTAEHTNAFGQADQSESARRLLVVTGEYALSPALKRQASFSLFTV